MTKNDTESDDFMESVQKVPSPNLLDFSDNEEVGIYLPQILLKYLPLSSWIRHQINS